MRERRIVLERRHDALGEERAHRDRVPATTRMSRPSTSRRCHGWCSERTTANCRCTQDLLESCACSRRRG